MPLHTNRGDESAHKVAVDSSLPEDEGFVYPGYHMILLCSSTIPYCKCNHIFVIIRVYPIEFKLNKVLLGFFYTIYFLVELGYIHTHFSGLFQQP